MTASECLKRPEIIAPVATLASIMTAIIIILSIQLYLLKRRIQYTRMYEKKEPPDIESLHRASVDNKYVVDTFPQQKTKLYRTQSVPINSNKTKSRVVSIYDTATCSSKLQTIPSAEVFLQDPMEDVMKPGSPKDKCPLPELPKKMDQAQPHYDEPIRHQYESIVEHVATTLSIVYNDSVKEGELYEKFFMELTRRIREKNPKLYYSMQHYNLNRNQYEEIKETNGKPETICKEHKSGDDSDDNCYAVFCSKKHDVEIRRNGKQASESKNSFGSSDHLKYFIETKRTTTSSEKYGYLAAKEFSAKNNCPEELKKLALNQTPRNDSQDANSLSENKRKMVIAERSSPPLRSPTTSRNVNNYNKRKSEAFASKAQMVENVLKSPQSNVRKLSISCEDIL